MWCKSFATAATRPASYVRRRQRSTCRDWESLRVVYSLSDWGAWLSVNDTNNLPFSSESACCIFRRQKNARSAAPAAWNSHRHSRPGAMPGTQITQTCQEANQRDLVDIRVNDDQFHGLHVLSWPRPTCIFKVVPHAEKVAGSRLLANQQKPCKAADGCHRDREVECQL